MNLKWRNFCIRLVVIFFHIDFAYLITATRYMKNYYDNHQPVFVNTSLVLGLTLRSKLTEDPSVRALHCDVNVVTPSSRRLLFHFLSLEISFDVKHPDRLHIFDYKASGEAARITPAQGLYGLFDSYYYTGRGRGVNDFVSSLNRLKLDYTGRPSWAYSGFKILVTSFKGPDGQGDCGPGFFLCHRKQICIPAVTWCDGFRNCGNDDNSDETDCDVVMTTGLNSFATTTAVMVASIACAFFLLTIGVAVYIVYRLNKRDAIKTNIVVYARRKAAKRQHSQQNGDLTNLYAPPSYEIVIGMDENPPPYQAVADIGMSDQSDDEDCDEDFMCLQGATASPETTTQIDDVIDTGAHGSGHCGISVTSALVTKDFDGNSCEPSTSTCTSDGPSLPPGQLQHSGRPSAEPLVKRVVINDQHSFHEIEVLSSEEADSDGSKDENSNKSKRPAEKLARIEYHRSPSKREGASIQFIDTDEGKS